MAVEGGAGALAGAADQVGDAEPERAGITGVSFRGERAYWIRNVR